MSSAQDNYRRAYDNRIGFGKRPALILIDFVKAYFDPGCALYADIQPALDSALRLRDAARVADIPVIYTNVVYQAGGADGALLHPREDREAGVRKTHHLDAPHPRGVSRQAGLPDRQTLLRRATFCSDQLVQQTLQINT